AVDHPGSAPPVDLPGISRRLRRALRLRHPPRGAAPLGRDAALAPHPSSAVLPALLRLQRLVALRRDGGLGEPVRRREPELGRVRGGSGFHGRGGGHAAMRALSRPGERGLPPWWHPPRLRLGGREPPPPPP